MVDAEKMSLDDAIQSPEVRQGEASGFWKFIDRKGELLYYEVTTWSRESYLLEITADRFQDEPLLGKFVDRESRICTEAAWPTGDLTFGGWFKWDPQHLFICWPGDRGGIGHHSEWRDLRFWNENPNPLYQYLEFIRQCLRIRGRGYQPRKK